MGFLNDLIRDIKVKNIDVSILDEGLGAGEFKGFIDTGCYILNAQLSGSIFGGIPNNRVSGLAGASSTGKTYIAIGLVKTFLDAFKDGVVFYYDTESAINKTMFEERGIDPKRVILVELPTVEKFQHHINVVLDKLGETKKRPPVLVILDSLGNLSTEAEMEGASSGDMKSDVGRRAKMIKAVFRVITLKSGKFVVPIFCTNHTYQAMDGNKYSDDVMAGGGGFVYAATQIGMLSSAKDRDDTTKAVMGEILTCKLMKSRTSRRHTQVKMKLSYDTGLDRYYGLLPLAEKYGIIKKSGPQYVMPDGSKVYGKHINAEPEKYYTQEVLLQLDEAAKKEFGFGKGEAPPLDDEEEIEEDTVE